MRKFIGIAAMVCFLFLPVAFIGVTIVLSDRKYQKAGMAVGDTVYVGGERGTISREPDLGMVRVRFPSTERYAAREELLNVDMIITTREERNLRMAPGAGAGDSQQ